MTPADVLIDFFERILENGVAAVDGLTDEQLAHRVTPDANSIAWLVWHTARVQDAQIAHAAGTEEVWFSQGWVERFDLDIDPADHGYGHTSEQVGKVRRRRRAAGRLPARRPRGDRRLPAHGHRGRPRRGHRPQLDAAGHPRRPARQHRRRRRPARRPGGVPAGAARVLTAIAAAGTTQRRRDRGALAARPDVAAPVAAASARSPTASSRRSCRTPCRPWPRSCHRVVGYTRRTVRRASPGRAAR